MKVAWGGEKVGMATDSDRLGGGEGKTLSGRQSMTDDLNWQANIINFNIANQFLLALAQV